MKKINRIWLVVVALSFPVLAHAVTVPSAPTGLCSSSGVAVTVINTILGALQLPPICAQ